MEGWALELVHQNDKKGDKMKSLYSVSLVLLETTISAKNGPKNPTTSTLPQSVIILVKRQPCFPVLCNSLFFYYLEILMIRFVICTFSLIFFIEIPFVLPPPPLSPLDSVRPTRCTGTSTLGYYVALATT